MNESRAAGRRQSSLRADDREKVKLQAAGQLELQGLRRAARSENWPEICPVAARGPAVATAGEHTVKVFRKEDGEKDYTGTLLPSIPGLSLGTGMGSCLL